MTTLPDLSSLKVKPSANNVIPNKPIEPPIIQNYVEPIQDIYEEAAEVIEK